MICIFCRCLAASGTQLEGRQTIALNHEVFVEHIHLRRGGEVDPEPESVAHFTYVSEQVVYELRAECVVNARVVSVIPSGPDGVGWVGGISGALLVGPTGPRCEVGRC